MSKDFIDHLAQDRRLGILRLLKDAGGTANESVLHSGLEQLGHRRQPRSAIRADLRHLIDKGCLIDEWFGDVQVVTITRRGVDVADGRDTAEGVKKPSLGV